MFDIGFKKILNSFEKRAKFLANQINLSINLKLYQQLIFEFYF